MADVSRTRIALLLPGYGQGGVFRGSVNLAEALQDAGWSPELWLGEAGGPGSFFPMPPGLPVAGVGRLQTGGSQERLVARIRERRPRAIFAKLHPANVAAVVARAAAETPAVRLAVAVHVTTSERTPTGLDDIAREMARHYPLADAILACAEGVAEDTARVSGIERERIRVVPNAVVSRRTAALRDAALAHPWFRPGEPPVVLGVGRLEPCKDFATLIDAFRWVKDARASRLLILGEGPRRPFLEERVARLGLTESVALAGYAENPYPFLARAAVFVSSSRSEGLANVVVEAMACSAPVVATCTRSGAPEVLQGGRFGRLVPVGEPFELASAILAALDSPGDLAAARRRADDFSSERAAAACLDAVGLPPRPEA